jgi:hypothetical protein
VSIVATELIEIALAGTDSPLVLRLETDGSTITVAVQHSGSAKAKTVRRKSYGDKITGMDLIAANCRAWGTHTSATGTTVWVVLGPENRV